ncbi:MAG: TVP38/TMEM64 family protein [Planctomycetota bacterium]
MNSTEEKTESTSPSSGGMKSKAIVAVLVIAAFGVLFYFFRQYMDLDFLAQQEQALKDLYAKYTVFFLAVAFLIYALVTGLSIPGATVMTLLYAWFLKFWTALVLISFASTAGATIAFLLSRYLFRDFIQKKFQKQLTGFNQSLEKEGSFYLFTLRLIPAVPFFVINAVMGLTRMKATTFWWVSQVGMFAGTCVYVYAGSRIPDLQTLNEKGINAVFTTSQMTQIFIAFALLGIFPLVVRKIMARFQKAEPAA